MNNFNRPFFATPYYINHRNKFSQSNFTKTYNTPLKNTQNNNEMNMPLISNSTSSNYNSNNKFNNEKKHYTNPVFQFANLSLYEDDILILSLIFLLYKENINDKLLLLALFSLLF